MSYVVKSEQARAAALGFWPGPIDGVRGARTQAAIAAATRAQREKGRPFIHDSGLTRIHLHWTAGGYHPSALDKRSYHLLIDGDGDVLRANDPRVRLAHTLNANGGAIAVSLCAMAGARERPFDKGTAPILAIQLAAMVRAAASLCRDFDIPVDRYSVLTHAEVQPTLGIKQRGKIDICWIPGMEAMGNPIEVGDRLRAMIARALRGVS